MQTIFHLKTSSVQVYLLWSLHGLTAALVAIYLSYEWLRWPCLAGLVLSLLVEHRRLIQNGKLDLSIIRSRHAIEILGPEQSHIFFKYKVYETRWFAILNLIDTQMNRTLILNPDSFESLDCYRRCRFQLRQLEGINAA